MKNRMIAIGFCLAAGAAWADGISQMVDGLSVGPVEIKAVSLGAWTFTTETAKLADGREVLQISLAALEAAVPPRFTVDFMVPQRDAHHRWTAMDSDNVRLPPDWWCETRSRLCSGIPLVAFLNDTDQNRILVAADEPKRTVVMKAGLNEEKCALKWEFVFFTEPEAPIKEYTVKLLLDQRDVFFGDAIREGVAWIESSAKLKTCAPPPDAFKPLYSAWYSFHQNVSDREIEAECVEAAKLGMKTLIVDDGWQTDDNNRGYRFTGDWEISKRRFPNMAEHVAKVHAMGMKYMVWYGVPMMGVKAKNYDRFRGKYLWTNDDQGFSCLDPRFSEVRNYICGFYERAMQEWDIDGFKLDFIDAFGFQSEDPAVKENYAGRDIKALPEAVDQLLADIRARLTAIKPDALIEFRQSYIGPAIRQYGNMMRATDCPGDLLSNRARTANLRLTSGGSAVHADMLEWNLADTPENAARFVLSTLFSVVQYSMMLRNLPEDHNRMVTHWIEFSRRHENALLHGGFRPHHFEAFYPWIESWNDEERIAGVYTDGTVVPVDASKKVNYVINATGTERIVLENAVPCEAEVFDTYGNSVGMRTFQSGLSAVAMPVSGYLRIGGQKPSSLDLIPADADKALTEAVETRLTPGAVVALVRDDRLVALKAYGKRGCPPYDDPMKVDTVFDMASCSKIVGTATAVMILADQGRLSLEDSVDKHIPGFEDYKGVKIKIAHLLSHTSGLPAYADFKMLVKKYGAGNKEGLLDHIRMVPRRFEPGTDTLYSCLNYIALQHIVEKVSGESLDVFTRRHIFERLGMSQTGYLPSFDHIHIAPTEVQTSDGDALCGVVHDPLARVMNNGVSGNAGLFSTAGDLALFCRMILNGGELNGRRILKEESVRKMMSVPDFAPQSIRTFGWRNCAPECGQLAGNHTSSSARGHTGYTGTFIMVDPEQNLAVILLTNYIHPHDRHAAKKMSELRRRVCDSLITGS